MHGKRNEYTDALVPELSAYDQDTGSRMPPQLDMDPWHPLLLQDSSGFLMPAFSSHVESCMNLELFCHNTTRTLDNPAIYTDTDTEPAFILSSDIGWDFSISKNIGASIDADPCCGGSSQPTRIYTAGLSDTYPIPRASNPDYESVQFHERRALSGINDETNDVLANNDSQLVQCDSSSWPNSNQLSTSKFNTKENRKPNPILPFQSIEDSSRYPCFSKGCKKTFKRKEHATRHYKTKHKKSRECFTCEFCGKNTFNRTDNLNAHRKLHGIYRPRIGNAVHFVPSAAGAIERNPRTKRGRPTINAH